ncbi:MAG: hypothetical protein GC138_03260 [Gammaproteobacteria bacterium]|nr:hypothetical protein [Gammaproteobacteria bacterium]
MNKLRRAAQWMWDHRGQDIWWRPPVLTAANTSDATNPGLSTVEAESVFRLLEDEKLIFPFQHPDDKKTAYLINEVRESEWKSFLEKMSPFYLYVTRPLKVVFKNSWVLLIWFLGTVIAAYLGAVILKTVE